MVIGMHPIESRSIAAVAVCFVFAASGCHEHSKQSLASANTAVRVEEARIAGAVKSKEAEAKDAAERLDAYIGDKFSDAEKALASKPKSQQPEPDAPTF
jgi:hypothetical protein